MRAALGREVLRFLAVGAAGTAACLGLYAVLRPAMAPQAANVVSRLSVAIPTTWLNGRYTFGARVSRPRMYGGAIGVLAAGTAISAGLLAAERSFAASPSRLAELAALVVATAVATVARFLLLRHWVFRPVPLPRPLER